MLRAVGRATSRLDLPPPAALTGEWFGALAVIAPSVSIQPVSGDDVFSPPGTGGPDATGAVGGGWVGYLSYPDARRRATPPDPRGRRRLDRLRAAPRPRRPVVV